MQVPLFLDPTIKLEKVAAGSRLEDDPDRWPIEILKVAYKNIPSLRSYEADIELDRVDQARGYAVGKMLVYPHGMTKEASSGADKLVSLPVIVRDHELSPFDTYSYKGSMYPMDESDLLEIMARPQTFERMADPDQFVGTNMSGQLTPPNTDHQYNAGSLTKQSSANLWNLAIINADARDVDAFKSVLRDDHALRHAYSVDPTLKPYVQSAFEFKEKTASDKRSERISELKPSVVQFSYSEGNFTVKTANSRCWAPQVEKTDRFTVQSMLPKESFNALLNDGYVTFTDSPLKGVVTEKVASAADRVGIYSVWNGPNNISGIVVPNTMSFNGRRLDSQMFIGDDRHAMQEKIAGVLLKDYTLQGSEPRGLGVFVYQEGDRAVAYEPVTVLNKIATVNEFGQPITNYHCKVASTGQEISLAPVALLHDVVELGSGEYAIPDVMKFVPLKGSQVTISSSDASQAFEHQKTASTSMTLHSGGDSYWFSGAHDLPFRGHEYGAQDTEFVLGGLGVSNKQVKSLMKTAAANGKVVIGKTREVLTEETLGFAHLKTASVHVRKFTSVMPKSDTFKVAAVLTSPRAQVLWKQASVALPKESLDAILSLNFMTPENASIYIGYLPLLEKTSSILAELVIASRLGMDDIRETAALNAMTQVNAVVKGLEKLSEKVQ